MSVTGFNQRRRELAAQQAAEELETTPGDLDDMTYNELRALAKEKGIDGYGSKKKLLEVLKAGEQE